MVDPGFDPAVVVSGSLDAFCEGWLGLMPLSRAIGDGLIEATRASSVRRGVPPVAAAEPHGRRGRRYRPALIRRGRLTLSDKSQRSGLGRDVLVQPEGVVGVVPALELHEAFVVRSVCSLHPGGVVLIEVVHIRTVDHV